MKTTTLVFLSFISSALLHAQFPYGTTGLLHMPTAEMQKDKTFMFGGSSLSIGATPKHWNYDTYNYYINITFFPWLEVGYACTLHRLTIPDAGIYNRFTNQDRQFSLRLRVLKEEQLWKYMPSIVLGANDPATNDKLGNPNKNDYEPTPAARIGNGHWNRYYIALTRHIPYKQLGILGIHFAYVYNRRIDYHLNGPAIGANFQFKLLEENLIKRVLNGLKLIIEYDSRTINTGLNYQLWKDHINIIAELNDFKYISTGIYFKVHLK